MKWCCKKPRGNAEAVRAFVGPALACAVLSLAPVVWAEDAMAPQKAEADRQFEQGKEALKRGDWPLACTCFGRSMQLDPSASTLVKLARCYEHDGRFKAASDAYAEAAAMLRDRPDSDPHVRALKDLVASSKQAIDARLARLVVRLNLRPPQLSWLLDGKAAQRHSDESPWVLDPGQHTLSVAAPGYTHEPVTVTLAEGETREVALVVRRVGPAASPGAPPTVASRPPPAVVAPATPAPATPHVTSGSAGAKPHVAEATPAHGAPSYGSATPRSSGVAAGRNQPRRTHGPGQKVVAATASGLGLVMLGMSGYFAKKTSDLVEQSRVDDHCDARYSCDATGKALLSQAESKQTWALLTGGAGLVMLGTGLVLWLTAPSASQLGAVERSRWALIVRPSGLGLGGQW